jgi:IclR family transcriptional regulator, acetate operon repressor
MSNANPHGEIGTNRAVNGPTRIRSVAKAVQILMLLSEESEGATAREVADGLGIPVATAHHLLNTLQAEGMLAKDSFRRYHLGPAVGALADAFMRRPAPPGYLLEPLRELAATTGETAYLSGWIHEDAVVLATLEGNHAVHVKGLHTGFAGFAHARAAGKVFLAHARPDVRERYLARGPLEPRTPNTIVDHDGLMKELARVAKQGYAIDHEEFTLGVTCVSAPVLEAGVAIAAYTVAAPTGRFEHQRAELTTAVLAAAHAARNAAGKASA